MGSRLPRFAGLALLIALTCFARHASAEPTLIMYCGVDENWCRAMTTEYQKETGVRVQMTRMSAGEIYARLRAEKDNPQADLWWGGTGDPHLQAFPIVTEVARLGTEAGGTIQVPHRRHLPRRSGLRLQHGGDQIPTFASPRLLG
jgi:hypothetical protein